MTRPDVGHGPRPGSLPGVARRDTRRRSAPHMLSDYAPHCGAGNGGDAKMKASTHNQLFAAAPVATIASAAPAERPRAGERTVRLVDLLPEAAHANARLYAFLYFVRDVDGRAAVYYAAPDALVHADARLLRGGDGSQQAVLALPRVCGGSSGGGGDAADAEAVQGGGYPETVPLLDDGDGFEDAGLILDRIVGVGDEYEDSTGDVRAMAAMAHAKMVGGAVYTQVDGDDGGIVYERGLHLVNRTGVYAVARMAANGGESSDGQQRNTDNGGLAGLIGEVSVYVNRAKPKEAAGLVAKAARSVEEAEYDARNGGACDDTPGLLSGAANGLVQAAAAYRSLADRAQAAAGSVRRAEAGARSALLGKCPVAGALRAGMGYKEYIDEWYDLDDDDRGTLFEMREDSEWYTIEFRDALERLEARKREHDAACTHPECAAAAAGSGRSDTAGRS